MSQVLPAVRCAEGQRMSGGDGAAATRRGGFPSERGLGPTAIAPNIFGESVFAD